MSLFRPSFTMTFAGASSHPGIAQLSPHPMNERTQKLRALMSAHDLDCKAVGKILGRTSQTVRVWRCDNTQTIPADALKILELTLAARNDKAG